MPPIEYTPKVGPELNVYEGLWKVASAGSNELSGSQAVEFFRKSGVDLAILKQVWSISTPSATMNMNQFFTALRLITMFQNGDIPINRERMISSSTINYGPATNFPKFNGVQLSLPPVASNPTTAIQSTASTTASSSATSGPTYAITPEEHLKYHNLFKTYDTNNDGYLSGAEARAIFAQSGLDQLVLRAIWELSDDDKDTQLNSKEFCVAFHLILCISKRQYPLPTSLPPALKTFLVAAPLIPALIPVQAPVPAPAPIQVPIPVAIPPEPAVNSYSLQQPSNFYAPPSAYDSFDTMPPIPLTSGSPRRRMSGSKTPKSGKGRPSFEENSSPVRTVEYIVSGLSDSEEVELTQTVTAIRDVSRKALQAGDVAVESNITNSSSLRLVLQRLQQEKIALTAAVESAEASATDSSNKLMKVVEELRLLQGQLTDLRAVLEEKRSQGSNAQSKISELQQEKQGLLNQISEVRGQIAQLSSEVSVTAIDVGKSEGLRAELDERSNILDEDKRTIEKEVADVHSELAFLQNILAALNQDKNGRAQELSRLQSQKTVSQAALARERAVVETKETEVQALKSQKYVIMDDKRVVLQKIAEKATLPGFEPEPTQYTEPTQYVEPTPAPAPTPAVSMKVLVSTPTTAHASGSAIRKESYENEVKHEKKTIHFAEEPIVVPIAPVEESFHDDFSIPSTPISAKVPLIRAQSDDPFEAFGKKNGNEGIPQQSGDEFATGFDKNPFDEAVFTTTASGETEVFDDDFAKLNGFDTPNTKGFDDDFATTNTTTTTTTTAHIVHAPVFDANFESLDKSEASKSTPVASVPASDGFEFSSFDKNPFDDPAFDTSKIEDGFTAFPVEFDAFPVDTTLPAGGVAPFEEFGNGSSSEKVKEAGFSDW